jgi:hypothetical protein
LPIDRQQLPHDPELLQQMVLDLIAQLDAEQLRRIKTERLLQQLLEARSGPRSEQLSPDQLRLFTAELAKQGVKLEEPAGAESTGKDADMPPPGPGGTPDDTPPGQPRRRALPRNLKRERMVGIPTKEITYSDPKSIKIGVREAGLLHIDRLIDMSQR